MNTPLLVHLSFLFAFIISTTSTFIIYKNIPIKTKKQKFKVLGSIIAILFSFIALGLSISIDFTNTMNEYLEKGPYGTLDD